MSPDPLGETLRIQLPPPMGTLTLRGSNGAFSTFRRITRERGLGPVGVNGRPGGIDLRDDPARAVQYLDFESFPLLVHALAEAHHPQLPLRDLEDVCTPPVMDQIGEPVIYYLLRELRPVLGVQDKDTTEDAVPDPPQAPRTPTSPSGRSGRTPAPRSDSAMRSTGI